MISAGLFQDQPRLQDPPNWTLTLAPSKSDQLTFKNDVPLELAMGIQRNWNPRKHRSFIYVAQCTGARQS